MKILKLMFVLGFVSGLAGCSGIAIGPELASTPSPFGTFSKVHVMGENLEVDISHATPYDTAVIYASDLGALPYDAEITYQYLTPAVAETNAERYQYWLVGFNLYKSADRSYYMIIRHLYGIVNLDNQDVEVAPLSCSLVALTDVKTIEVKNATSFDQAGRAGSCSFDSKSEVFRVGAKAIEAWELETTRRRDLGVTHSTDLQDIDSREAWQSVKVKIIK
jgi:hypothetical protein